MLDADQVTVVDQQGRLLSAPKSGEDAAAAEQFEAAHRVEESYVQHIEALLAPLVGEGRVRAQVTVDLDTGASEEAREQYKPDSAIVRSEQTTEESSRGGEGAGGGVPGSLSNQPPAGGVAVAASARPAGGNGATGAAATGAAAGSGAVATPAPNAVAVAASPESTSKQSSRNYEIDRTVSYSHQAGGRIKRVTVAVLLDNVRGVGADGKPTDQPLKSAQLEDITRLVKNAVGFDEARGDSVNVVNAPFLTQTETLKPEEVPLWQRPWLMSVLRLTLGAVVLIALALFVLRPLIKNLAGAVVSTPVAVVAAPAGQVEAAGVVPSGAPLAYEQQIVQARTLVTQDPKRVAQVVRTWVGEQQ
jgi:flagellar M-ring protein FliF